MINFGDNETFIANYQKLKSSRKMGELYGCDKKTVTTHAKKIGYDYTGNKELKITKFPVEDIYNEYLDLGSTYELAKKYNCSATSVAKYLKNNGYTLNQSVSGKLSNVSDEEFIANYQKLNNKQQMAKLYNCSANAITEHAKKIGCFIQKQYKLSDTDKQYILEHYETKTSNELADKFQVSRGMITKLWHDHNLQGKQVINPKTTEIDLTGQSFGLWTVLNKSEYRTASGGIMWNCKCSCGIERPVSGLSLRRGQSLSCGSHANISRGNEKIKQLLQQANIDFQIEKKFNTCKDKKELPFDFYVNNEYLIEYDGIQHFSPGLFDYEYTHQHDLIKSDWCKKNNIPLIRIPYTHYDNLSIEDLILESSKFIEK